MSTPPGFSPPSPPQGGGPPDSTTNPSLRASDIDRQRYAALLGEAFAAGQLNQEEFDSRVGEALKATYLGDLPALVADINLAALAGPAATAFRSALPQAGQAAGPPYSAPYTAVPPAYPVAPTYAPAFLPEQPGLAGPGQVAPLPTSSEERTWGTLSHLGGIFFSFLAPLVVWLVQKDHSRFVDQQAKEALNFQITLAIAYFVSGLLVVVLIGMLLLPAVWVAGLVSSIMAAAAANRGEPARYPLSIRFIK